MPHHRRIVVTISVTRALNRTRARRPRHADRDGRHRRGRPAAAAPRDPGPRRVKAPSDKQAARRPWWHAGPSCRYRSASRPSAAYLMNLNSASALSGSSGHVHALSCRVLRRLPVVVPDAGVRVVLQAGCARRVDLDRVDGRHRGRSMYRSVVNGWGRRSTRSPGRLRSAASCIGTRERDVVDTGTRCRPATIGVGAGTTSLEDQRVNAASSTGQPARCPPLLSPLNR